MHFQILIPEPLFELMLIMFIFLFLFVVAVGVSVILFPDVRRGLIEDWKRPVKW